jgi:hypothetical protein
VGGSCELGDSAQMNQVFMAGFSTPRGSAVGAVGGEVEKGVTALSLGERVVRQLTDSEPGEGLLRQARSTAGCRATDPSPVPLRLVKAPAAGHPLPTGEGKGHLSACCLLPTAYFA